MTKKTIVWHSLNDKMPKNYSFILISGETPDQFKTVCSETFIEIAFFMDGKFKLPVCLSEQNIKFWAKIPSPI